MKRGKVRLPMSYRAFTRLRALFIVVLVAAAVGVGWFLLCGRQPIRNVILISIDTCRADHLGCYGFRRHTSPNIDALAAEGIVFENAYTPYPLTLPAHCSMLTGTYPPYHKVRDNLNFALDGTNVTVAEILGERGFATGAVIGAFVLDSQFGLDQGFDSYNDEFVEPIRGHRSEERRGGEVSEFACRFIEKHKQEPFFLFLHYYDPHTDYEPPEPFASEYADDLYSGEIAYTDHCIAEVIDKLKGLGLYDSTLIIIVADHGEGLGEHGETEHGYFIYQCTTRVPFIIRAPGSAMGKEVSDIVSLVDIVPTILGYLKIDVPDHNQGKDLSDYSDKRLSTEAKRTIYVESLIPTKYTGNPLLGLNTNRYEYIKTNRPELYDLLRDRDEKNNLVDKEPHRARLMDGQLQEFSAKLAADKEINSTAVLTEETRKRLESLGYVGGSSVSTVLEFYETRKDPKDLIEYYEQAVKLMYLKYDEQYAAARAVGENMLAKWPEIPNTLFMMTRLSFDQCDMADTIEYGTRYLEVMSGRVDLSLEPTGLSPTKPIAKTHDFVAVAAFKLGKYDLAIKHWIKALELKADWPEVHNNLAGAYYRLGRVDEAIAHWSEALRLKPDWAEVRDNLDKLMARKERDAEIAQYTEMLQHNPDDPNTHNKLAAAFYRKGDVEKVIEHWGEAVRLKTDWAEVGNNLAWVLATAEDEKLRNPTRAVELAERACELTDYNQPAMLDTLGVAYAAAGRFAEAVEIAEKAKELAVASGRKELVSDIEKHLELYKVNKPYSD